MTPLRELYELYRYPDTLRKRRAGANFCRDSDRCPRRGQRGPHVAACCSGIRRPGGHHEPHRARGRSECARRCRTHPVALPGPVPFGTEDAGRRDCRCRTAIARTRRQPPRSGRNTTALIEAARNRYHGLIAALVDSGQRLDSTDRNGDNALHVLCQRVAETTDDIRRAEQRIEGFAERWTSEKQKPIRSANWRRSARRLCAAI